MFSHPPADYRNGQMQQRLEIDGFFLVSEHAACGNCSSRNAFSPPPSAARTLWSCTVLRPSFLGDVRDIASLPHLLLGGFARVALIHTEILGPTLRRFRPWDYDRVSVWASNFTSCRLAPATISESGAPRPSTSRLRLVPFFPDRLGCFHRLLRQGSFALSPVEACIPRQSPPSRRTVANPARHSRTKILPPPPLKVMVNGTGAAKALGRCLPLAAGAKT